MNKYKITPSKEDLKFVEDLTSHWNVGNNYVDPIDFTYRNDEAEG
jgi:hypothetical protein